MKQATNDIRNVSSADYRSLPKVSLSHKTKYKKIDLMQ